MNRRTFISGAAAATLASAVAKASHHHKNHGAHSKWTTLSGAAFDCVRDGEHCLQHCLTALRDGDQTMTNCSMAVNEMLAVCNAMGRLAAQESKLTSSIKEACKTACANCEQACKKHAGQHATCARCADSCRAMLTALKSL